MHKSKVCHTKDLNISYQNFPSTLQNCRIDSHTSYKRAIWKSPRTQKSSRYHNKKSPSILQNHEQIPNIIDKSKVCHTKELNISYKRSPSILQNHEQIPIRHRQGPYIPYKRIWRKTVEGHIPYGRAHEHKERNTYTNTPYVIQKGRIYRTKEFDMRL